MNEKKQHKTSIGGQALIEGIMMRGPKGTAMSVRMPDGTIDTEVEQFVPITKKNKIRDGRRYNDDEEFVRRQT